MADCRVPFLAGISGGSLGVILTMMKLRGLSGDLPLLKASSSIALATILLGMLCLVLDLTDPLFFWRILVFYNPTSVMSVGVMMLLFYIPLTAVLTVIVLRHSLKWLPFGLGGLVENWATSSIKPEADHLDRSLSGIRYLRLHRLPDFRTDPLSAHQYGRAASALRSVRRLGGRRCSQAPRNCGIR